MTNQEILDRLLEIEIDIENGTRLADKESLISAFREVKTLQRDIASVAQETVRA